MLTSVVFFAFAYGGMLRALLPSARELRSVARGYVALLLPLGDGPLVAALACMNIAGTATCGARNDAITSAPHNEENAASRIYSTCAYEFKARALHRLSPGPASLEMPGFALSSYALAHC